MDVLEIGHEIPTIFQWQLFTRCFSITGISVFNDHVVI